jgi:ABC-2 type transport system permease protein
MVAELLLTDLAWERLAAIRDEEASGRLDNLLVRPVSRLIWLIGRLGVSLVVVVLARPTGSLFGWLGAASQHVGVPLATLLGNGAEVRKVA